MACAISFASRAPPSGNTAVFRVIEASVGDLQPGDGGADRRQLGGEAGFAQRLGGSPGGRPGGEAVDVGERGVDAFDVAEALHRIR